MGVRNFIRFPEVVENRRKINGLFNECMTHYKEIKLSKINKQKKENKFTVYCVLKHFLGLGFAVID